MAAAFPADGGKSHPRFRLTVAAVGAGHRDFIQVNYGHSKWVGAAETTQRAAALAGVSGIFSGSTRRPVGTVGATLFGLTSVLPTKVTPSSMASFVARISPNTSALALIST